MWADLLAGSQSRRKMVQTGKAFEGWTVTESRGSSSQEEPQVERVQASVTTIDLSGRDSETEVMELERQL